MSIKHNDLQKISNTYHPPSRLLFDFKHLLLAGMVGLFALPAQAELSAHGLPHPDNHFPVWYKDSNNVTLQLCLDGDGVNGPCLYDPVIPGNAFSEATGFGPEAFWWSADSGIDLADGGRAILVMGMEAAYLNGDPHDGDQFAFGRVRIRIDAPVAGIYKVTHPYLAYPACLPEEFTVAAGTRVINETRDIGGGAPFDAALGGEIGPFLVWDPAVAPLAPAGYVGDPQVEHAVTGSKCGFNYFKVEGPTGSNLGGAGVNTVQNNLFSVQGKIFDEINTPPPAVLDRATYNRTQNIAGNLSTRVNVWAQSTPGATVTLSGLPAGNGPMTGDGSGNFYKRVTLNNVQSQTLPANVTVTSTIGALTRSATKPLTDQVDVNSVPYNIAGTSLSIVAFSSEKRPSSLSTLTTHVGALPPVVMTPDPATPGRYTATVPGVVIPPTAVTVTSSKGGVDTEAVQD